VVNLDLREYDLIVYLLRDLMCGYYVYVRWRYLCIVLSQSMLEEFISFWIIAYLIKIFLLKFIIDWLIIIHEIFIDLIIVEYGEKECKSTKGDTMLFVLFILSLSWWERV